MPDGVMSARLMTRPRLAWISCVVVLTAVGWTETVFYPRSHRVLVPLLIAGMGYIILGRYVRHRWGARALAAAGVLAITLCTASLATLFLDVLDLSHSLDHPLRLPTLLALSNSAWALVPIGILLQRSARRSRPLLNWDLPAGIIACALGGLIGFALDVAYMVVTTGGAVPG